MTEHEFCEAVAKALKGDHNDLRKEAIILQAHRAVIAAIEQAGDRPRVYSAAGNGMLCRAYRLDDYGCRW